MFPWVYRVLPYIKNRQIFVCPSDPMPKDPIWQEYCPANPWNCGACAGVAPGGQPTALSYAPSAYVIVMWSDGVTNNPCGWGPGTATPVMTMAGIPTPAATYLMGDSDRQEIGAPHINDFVAANFHRVYDSGSADDPQGGHAAAAPGSPFYDPFWVANMTNPSIYRHQMGSNLIYCDGHAKWRTGGSIESGYPDFDLNVSSEGVCVREYPGTAQSALDSCNPWQE
jgi:hypothetical protein